MEWVNRYLASPYEDGARGPARYDCWGLVREARHLHLGKRLLPSWGDVRNTQAKAFTRAYLAEAKTMQPCEPEAGAIAAVMRGHVCIHVALVLKADGRLMILETNPESGPRYLPLDRWRRQYLSVFYWKDA